EKPADSTDKKAVKKAPVKKDATVKRKVAQKTPQGITQGNCEQWFIEAGITDLVNARELLRRENAGCNPQLYNLSGSGACGVAQELPCGKSGCGIPPNADGLCQ